MDWALRSFWLPIPGIVGINLLTVGELFLLGLWFALAVKRTRWPDPLVLGALTGLGALMAAVLSIPVSDAILNVGRIGAVAGVGAWAYLRIRGASQRWAIATAGAVAFGSMLVGSDVVGLLRGSVSMAQPVMGGGGLLDDLVITPTFAVGYLAFARAVEPRLRMAGAKPRWSEAQATLGIAVVFAVLSTITVTLFFAGIRICSPRLCT